MSREQNIADLNTCRTIARSIQAEVEAMADISIDRWDEASRHIIKTGAARIEELCAEVVGRIRESV